MATKLLGTGIIADFPTINGNIYPKEVVDRLLSEETLKERISFGELIGGILDPKNLVVPKDGIITHRVIDVRLFNDEIVVEVDMLETSDAQQAMSKIEKPMAALVLRGHDIIGKGCIINDVDAIRAVHIHEA